MMSSLAVAGVTSGPAEQELERLFREHYQMLYRTAYSLLGDSHDAEDVPQTIFLRLLRSGITAGLAKNPKAYLYRAAVNLSLNIIRSRKRQPAAVDVDSIQISGHTLINMPGREFHEERHRRLAQAIAQLDPQAAQIVILRYVHDYSDADIAKLFGTSRGTVALRLFRIRARLRKLMRSSEGEHQ